VSFTYQLHGLHRFSFEYIIDIIGVASLNYIIL